MTMSGLTVVSDLVQARCSMVYESPCESDPLGWDAPNPKVDRKADTAGRRIAFAIDSCMDCRVFTYCGSQARAMGGDALGVMAGVVYWDKEYPAFTDKVREVVFGSAARLAAEPGTKVP